MCCAKTKLFKEYFRFFRSSFLNSYMALFKNFHKFTSELKKKCYQCWHLTLEQNQKIVMLKITN